MRDELAKYEGLKFHFILRDESGTNCADFAYWLPSESHTEYAVRMLQGRYSWAHKIEVQQCAI